MTADNASFRNGSPSTRIRMGSSVTYSQTMNDTRPYATREIPHAGCIRPKRRPTLFVDTYFRMIYNSCSRTTVHYRQSATLLLLWVIVALNKPLE
ncbi:hypothetical protein CDAR_421541 [Caerostris darwini]|uniref:Uncharacterized protein n=1 Tax=Caerostris darwini TaxID=1538125 RepID=A0AAV4SXL5_9ARAC|nr:hypothetical protein CDAR_421541 [Caerostris darwini]